MIERIDHIDIKEVKDNVNLFLFNSKGIGLKELELSNKICELLGGATNEVIDSINSFN